MGISTDGFPVTPYLYSWAYTQQATRKAHKYLVTYYKDTRSNVLTVHANSEEEAKQLVQGYLRSRQINLSIKELY